MPFKAIGAEYGEGFETFRADGALKVDVVGNFGYNGYFQGINCGTPITQWYKFISLKLMV